MDKATKRHGSAGLHWDGTIGPAFLVGAAGSLSVLVTIGWMWANQAADTRSAAKEAADAKAAANELVKDQKRRDDIINEHSVALGKIVTKLEYVAPQLDRIEKKLDAQAPTAPTRHLKN